MNKDKLNAIDAAAVATAAATVIDAVQDMEPERQIAGVTAAFKILVDHLKVDPQDVMTVVGNIISDNTGPGKRVELDAVADYMRGELS